MRYTSVGSVGLGFDLARLDGGPECAEVLRTALRAGPQELDRLAAAHPGLPSRRARHGQLARLGQEREALAGLLPLSGEALAESMGGEVRTLRRLERGLLGNHEGLDHLVRHDVLDWTWLRSGDLAVQDPVAHDAADVIVDAALAHYLDLAAAPGLRAELLAPWESAAPERGDVASHTTTPGVTRLLDRLTAAGPEDLRRLREVVDQDRPAVTARWAPSVHRATWAASTSERLRSALDTQLAGVIAFRSAGLDASDAAYGVWNAVAGGLQAALVADLLPASDTEVLLSAWRALPA